MKSEAERFNINHPDLCHCLHWKGLFIVAEPDPTVPSTHDHHYWCVFTQTCLGPDGKLAEPGECSSADRVCYKTGKV